MLECSSCSNWFHGNCVGINANDEKSIEQFKCKRCLEIESTKIEESSISESSSKVQEIPVIVSSKKKPVKKKNQKETKIQQEINDRNCSKCDTKLDEKLHQNDTTCDICYPKSLNVRLK